MMKLTLKNWLHNGKPRRSEWIIESLEEIEQEENDA